jgi:hypothetical protein
MELLNLPEHINMEILNNLYYMNPGDYIIYKKILNIVGEANDVHLTFSCPFCYEKYKKNGDPYRNAKKLVHLHGNDYINYKTRNFKCEGRAPHCKRLEKNGLNEYIIYIKSKIN